MWKKISLILFIIFYGFAGINHFLNPETYEQLIPNWLGDSAVINLAAGVVEIAVAILAIFKPTRKWAGYLTIAMLLAFIISHSQFVRSMFLIVWNGCLTINLEILNKIS